MSDVPEKTYRLSIRRPVTMAMLFVTLLVFGWRSYQQLPLNLMPDISYPTLTVRTEYEGAAPEDVEKLVTRGLEERLSIVTGVVEISSVSSAGLSEIILEFRWDTDMNVAMQDVRESLDMFQPPQGVTRKPVILRYDPTLDPVMRVAITGRDLSDFNDDRLREQQRQSDLTEIRAAAKEHLKSDLEAEPGIAQVLVKGGREEEIQILLDSSRLKNLGLSPAAIVTSLQQHNVNLSGGRLKEGRAEYLVRTLNEFQDLEEIRAVIIGTVAGQQFRLDDLARVRLGVKERVTVVRVNGREAVELEFYKEGDANIVEVSRKLRDFFKFERKRGVSERFFAWLATKGPSSRNAERAEQLEQKKRMADQLTSRLPSYATPILVTDQSRFIEASIREVQRTALVGGVLALFVLFLFLRELRSTAIIGAAIPISVIATFVPMFMMDVSLNIMSLGGIALGIGMLVDNSIVVLESIFRCREEGDSTVDAAERGTKEVAGAVTASTLTTIAVFFPIVFVEGIAGQLFRDLALTVTFSLLASLSVALYLIPMIASREGLHLLEGESAIWFVRAAAQAKSEGARGLGILRGIPGYARRSGRAWLVETWAETAGAVLKSAREASRAARLGFLAFVPLVVVLFVLQSVLKLVSTILISVLFGVTMGVLGVLWVVGRGLWILLYLPMNIFDRGFRVCRGAYTVVLRHALHFSPVVLIAVVLLSMHAAQVSLGLGRELIPPFKQGEFGIRVVASPGTRLETMERRAREVEAIVAGFDEVDSVMVQVGKDDTSSSGEQGENVATLTVKLRNPEETASYQDEIIERMRVAVLAKTSDQVTFTLPTLFSFKTAMEIQLYGEDLDQLGRLGDEVIASIEDVRGLQDVDLSLKKGYPEIHIVLDRDLLSSLQLEPYQVAQMLRTEVQGDIATRFSRGGEKIDIRVRSDQERLRSLDDLKMLSIVDGFPPTPLSSVARIEIEEGPSEIRRVDQRQVVLVTGNVEGRDLGGVARDVEDRLAQMSWPDGYTYALGGQNRELQTSYQGLLFALSLAVFLVYVVMACQFESIWHPALIMFSVPLAFVGVVYVLAWFEVNVSMVVFIGGIVLAGIVVNSAIVLVDYINQLRARGLKKVDAIVEAGTVRFRPILMTAMTTVLGLIPMVISQGEGAEIRRPMAITVIAGLTSATILTLFIIPIIYNFFGGRDPA